MISLILVYGSCTLIHFWFGLYLSPKFHFSLTYFTRILIADGFFPIFTVMCLGILLIFFSSLFFFCGKLFGLTVFDWIFLHDHNQKERKNRKKKYSHDSKFRISHNNVHVWLSWLIWSADHLFYRLLAFTTNQIKMPIEMRWIHHGAVDVVDRKRVRENKKEKKSRINCFVIRPMFITMEN